MKSLSTLLTGGILIGEHIVVNPAKGDDNNLAHTTAVIQSNTGFAAANFASDLINQVDHHTKLLALLGPGYAVRPWTLMSPTVDMRKFNQAVQMWTWAQYACGRAVADCVHDDVIPKDLAETLLIGLQIFIHPAADSGEAIFQCQYEAAYLSIERAMKGTQDVGMTLDNRTKVVHLLCQDDKKATLTPEAMQKLIDGVHANRAA